MAEKQSIKRFIVRDPHGHIEHEDSFSVVGEVHVDIVPGCGEPYAESVYVNGILTITIHNIEGNGIASFEQVESSEADGGVNTWRLTDDTGSQYDLTLRNGTKGEKGDTGKQGEQGPQGDSVIVGEGDMPLAHTMGYSTEKAISQKGMTGAINERTSYVSKAWIDSDINSSTPWWPLMSNDTFASMTSNYSGRRIEIDDSDKGKTIKITKNGESPAIIALLKTWPSSSNKTADYCENTSRIVVDNSQFITKIPEDCKYIYVAYKENGIEVTPAAIEIEIYIKDKIAKIEEFENTIKSEIGEQNKKLSIIEKEWDSESWGSDVFWYILENVYRPTTANYYARLAKIDNFAGKAIEITAGGYNARFAFLKSRPTASGQAAEYCEGTTLNTLVAGNTVSLEIPGDCVYLYVDYKYGGNINIPEYVAIKENINEVVKDLREKKGDIVYLSANGNDDYDGKSITSPKATFAAAMNAGGIVMTVVLLSDIDEVMNLSLWNGQKKHVTIQASKDARARVKVGKILTGLTEYQNGVYKWTPGEGESLPSGSHKWLWQHDLPDAQTQIIEEERHPLQRGRIYRRLSTRIMPVNSLAELTNSEIPCWVVDNGSLYVKVAEGSNIGQNPIIVPGDNDSAIIGAAYDVTLLNVEAWYGNIKTGSGSYNFKAEDCAARYCTGSGAWQIDDSMCVKLIRCEADSTTMPSTSTGDGFNLHPTNAQDVYAKGGTHTLIDCWAHDCRDDGYSDHARAEGTIIGGLFEYCGKGGLTPSYGSHDTIYAATARHCNSGIYCAGETNDGSMGTQVACHGVVSTDNVYNFRCLGYSSNQQIGLYLNQCISRNASSAGVLAAQNCLIILRDCTDHGSATIKKADGEARIIVDNGEIII